MSRRAGDAILLGRYTPGTPEWHDARRGALGGSEIAAVLGLSPWQSRWSLWHYKAGVLEPNGTSPRQRVGQVLEDAVVTLYTERTGDSVRRTGMWANRERPWQVAEPDRLIVHGPRSHRPTGILECKTADRSTAFEWGPDGTTQHGLAWNGDTGEWLGVIPPHYACQVLWYLDTFGLDRAHLAVLLGFELRVYDVTTTAETAAYLREEGERFLASVREDRPPPVDSSTSTYTALRAMHPDIDGRDVETPAPLADAFTAAHTDLKRAEKAWAAQRNLMAHHMGTAATASLAGARIAVRKAKPGATPWVEAARNGRTTP